MKTLGYYNGKYDELENMSVPMYAGLETAYTMQVPAEITGFLQLTSTLTASSTAPALSGFRCHAQRQS